MLFIGKKVKKLNITNKNHLYENIHVSTKLRLLKASQAKHAQNNTSELKIATFKITVCYVLLIFLYITG